jgi:threonine dehydrogenase-like Zn-dependent dehydrogenase
MQAYLGAHVIAVEPSRARRDLALKMGAWQVVDPAAESDMVGLLKGLTDGIGPDECFECSGRQDTLDVAMDATKPEGLIMMVGHGPQTLDPQRLIIKRNLTISGNWVAHPAWYPAMLQMYREGLDVERLITGRFPYTQAQEAYDGMVNGTSGKVMIMWE